MFVPGFDCGMADVARLYMDGGENMLLRGYARATL